MDMINTIDEIAYELMIKLMSSGMTNFMLFMSHLGSAITLIVLTIAFILLLKNKTNSKFIAISRRIHPSLLRCRRQQSMPCFLRA